MKKYSRQRAAIVEALRSTDCHPTAQWVYETVKKSIPNISLGTVYRNLSELSLSGQIITVPVYGHSEHYDGDNSDHYHFCCKECNKVYDVPKSDGIHIDVENELGCVVTGSSLVFYGICQECLKK